MRNFDSNFAEAVALLLKEEDEKKKDMQPKVPGKDVIKWSPGPGSWSDVIMGLKSEADIPYDSVVAVSSASKSAGTLMIRLGINKPSTSSNGAEAAVQILNQAFKNSVMSETYDTPTGTPSSVMVKFKLPTDKESIKNEEGISARNATVYIHLTLIGAYNAGYLNIESGKKITLNHSDAGVTITG